MPDNRYYEYPKTTAYGGSPASDADRDNADREFHRRLKAVENAMDAMPVVPTLPTTKGNYFLTVSGSTTKTNNWTTCELPALPTSDGTYKLKVTVTGSKAAYDWEAETDADR